MKTRGFVVPALLLTLVACGGGGTDDHQEDEAVPPGAIPAAPDARPEEAASGLGSTAVGDTADTVAPTASAGSDTTPASAGRGRIIPR